MGDKNPNKGIKNTINDCPTLRQKKLFSFIESQNISKESFGQLFLEHVSSVSTIMNHMLYDPGRRYTENSIEISKKFNINPMYFLEDSIPMSNDPIKEHSMKTLMSDFENRFKVILDSITVNLDKVKEYKDIINEELLSIKTLIEKTADFSNIIINLSKENDALKRLTHSLDLNIIVNKFLLIIVGLYVYLTKLHETLKEHEKNYPLLLKVILEIERYLNAQNYQFTLIEKRFNQSKKINEKVFEVQKIIDEQVNPYILIIYNEIKFCKKQSDYEKSLIELLKDYTKLNQIFLVKYAFDLSYAKQLSEFDLESLSKPQIEELKTMYENSSIKKAVELYNQKGYVNKDSYLSYIDVALESIYNENAFMNYILKTETDCYILIDKIKRLLKERNLY